MSLKRKKAYEKQIEQIDNSISRVNEQQMMLENQRTTAETVLALQQGVRANKATMQVPVRSVHNANLMPQPCVAMQHSSVASMSTFTSTIVEVSCILVFARVIVFRTVWCLMCCR